MEQMTVTEQDIAKFQEAFFTRPGDGSLTAERVKKILISLELPATDADVQVVLSFSRDTFKPRPTPNFLHALHFGHSVIFRFQNLIAVDSKVGRTARKLRIQRCLECYCFKV